MISRYFVQKCCNNNKKPTGQSAPDPFTEKCQLLCVYHAIVALGQLTQTQTQMYDSQDQEFGPSLEDEFSSSSDLEESVIANPFSINRITTSIPLTKVSKFLHNNYYYFIIFYYYIHVYIWVSKHWQMDQLSVGNH